MEKFPTKVLRVRGAKLSGNDGEISIEFDLEPFNFEVDGYQDRADTSIRLDGISLPNDPTSLEEQEFTFPVNPEAGYIDGSVYILAAHNPVDVTKLRFGKLKGKTLPVDVESLWDMEFECTGFKSFLFNFSSEIEL
ncbi:hypothetical protein JNO04_15270 [Halomonas sp. MC140]|nr:hypothetical protein [Halomonas sp. MC140]MDN7133705.1 hypothetical protein [Halomonas sp. MC140]